eukprot:TRINITY_DN7825_c0_g1_i1.p1 TRINITY_DN7825_c0_g1~~TRINITY_DN7825_c0_g1_i1.p1  ORF type:complete len:634 (-),score=97.49 TRINITY_DN7825_c0_g1_i1:65-1966(-)
MVSFWDSIFRRKTVDLKKIAENSKSLTRTLGPVDLTAFGVGTILGAGIFVLTGVAARQKAGPAVAISFLFDALACIFSALCYSEFAARVPLAGSAYIYGYVSVGEIIGYAIGWALCLEYGFSVAAVSRGWSGYLQALLSSFSIELPSWLESFNLGPFQDVDLLSMFVVIALSFYLLFGIENSSQLNMIITALCVGIILFVVGFGSFLVDTHNWTNNFAPFGISGVFAGSATVFFAFIGFDSVANLSEDAKRPSRDIPIGVISSLLICAVLYVAVSLVVTGMVPYNTLSLTAPLSEAFTVHGYSWASSIISLGAFAGLTTTILASLISISRVIYAMSRDGLLPAMFSFVWTYGKEGKTTSVPIVATLTAGAGCATLAFLLDIEILSDLVSMGTLVAFTVVCACVLILRLKDRVRRHDGTHADMVSADRSSESSDSSFIASQLPSRKTSPLHMSPSPIQSPSTSREYDERTPMRPSTDKGTLSTFVIVMYTYRTFLPSLLISYVLGVGVVGFSMHYPFSLPVLIVALLCVAVPFVFITFGFFLSLFTLPPSANPPSFKCPLVPFVPLAGMGVNIFMITNLDLVAWIGFGIWMLVGMLIYLTYGYWHSAERRKDGAWSAGYEKIGEVDDDIVVVVE